MEKFGNDQHTIYLGDSLNILKDYIEDSSIDLIFADPPYNIGKKFKTTKDKWKYEHEYLEWCYQWIDLCIRKLKENGSFYVMTSTQFMPYFDIYIREKMSILSRIVWTYDSSGVQARKFYGSMYEPILFCVKNQKNYIFNANDILVEAKTGSVRKLIDYRKKVPTVYNSKKVPGNVWNINRVRFRMDEFEDHPTQKPIALLERIIKASTNPGDLVLDPFSGSFTTSYAASLLNRRSIGIDIEEHYVKIGLRRLRLATNFKGERLIKYKRDKDKENDNTSDNNLFFDI